jgi:hypothetical protein
VKKIKQQDALVMFSSCCRLLLIPFVEAYQHIPLMVAYNGKHE